MLSMIFLGSAAQSLVRGIGESRDETSIKLLSDTFNQSESRLAWKALHSVHLQGSVSARVRSDNAWITKTSTIDWVEDWSTGRPRYKRLFSTDGKQRMVRHDGAATFKARMGSKTLQVPQLDSTTVLLTHAPAAALAMILSDQSYSIQMKPELATAKDNVVEVSNTNTHATQVWFLSRATGQVNAVRFTVPDAMNLSHKVWETAVYTHYASVDGLTYPDKVTVYRPNGQTLDYTFTSFEKNPSVTAQDFTSGAAQ